MTRMPAGSRDHAAKVAVPMAEPASLRENELAAYCPDLDEWPARWRYEQRDVAPGQKLVECFKPFLCHLLTRICHARPCTGIATICGCWAANSFASCMRRLVFAGGRSTSLCSQQLMRTADHCSTTAPKSNNVPSTPRAESSI